MLLLVFDLVGSVITAIGAAVALILPGENRRKDCSRNERLTRKGKVAIGLIFVGLTAVIGSKLEGVREKAQATEDANNKHRELVNSSARLLCTIGEAGKKIESVSTSLDEARTDMLQGQRVLHDEIEDLSGTSQEITDAVQGLNGIVAHAQLLQERFEGFTIAARINGCTTNESEFEVWVRLKRGANDEMAIRLWGWKEGDFRHCSLEFREKDSQEIRDDIEGGGFWDVKASGGGTDLTLEFKVDSIPPQFKEGLEVRRLRDLVGTWVQLEIHGIDSRCNVNATIAINGLGKLEISMEQHDGAKWKGRSSDLDKVLGRKP